MADPDESIDLFGDDTPGEMVDEEEKECTEESQTGQSVPENRIMISKIVCKNFKSYAGVKELGPFHKVGLIL